MRNAGGHLTQEVEPVHVRQVLAMLPRLALRRALFGNVGNEPLQVDVVIDLGRNHAAPLPHPPGPALCVRDPVRDFEGFTVSERIFDACYDAAAVIRVYQVQPVPLPVGERLLGISR